MSEFYYNHAIDNKYTFDESIQYFERDMKRICKTHIIIMIPSELHAQISKKFRKDIFHLINKIKRWYIIYNNNPSDGLLMIYDFEVSMYNLISTTPHSINYNINKKMIDCAIDFKTKIYKNHL